MPRSARPIAVLTPEALAAAGRSDTDAVLMPWLEDLESGLRRARRGLELGETPGAMIRTTLWLNADEVDSLSDELRGLLQKYEDRTRADRSPGAVPWAGYALLLPEASATQEGSGPASH